ncbi:MAG: PAS domain S-box protein [Ignavibacteriales bacterium]|nr:PAS domain S-box protein [Ignavibacteriales bacterium]
MKESLQSLFDLYSTVLYEYLKGAGEAGLERAYELGRKAVEEGVGCLDLLKMHEDVVDAIMRENHGATEELARNVHTATRFFAESLSPYEMTSRGFQEAIETLKARAADLADINRQLEKEIHEKEQVEKALRESEERYRLLIDTARDVIYTLSPEGIITTLNPAFERITGWPRHEWIGKAFQPLVHPDDLGLAMQMFQKVLSGESPAFFELRVVSRSGEILVGEFVSTPQFNNNIVVGALGVARDITARKRAEEKLRQNEELFRLITGNITDLIAILDTQGRRLYNSPSYGPLLGLPEDLLGTDSFADVHPDDRNRIRRIFLNTVASGLGHREEYRLLSKNGAVRHIESQGNVIRNKGGKIEQVVVVSRDISERKIVEEKLKQSEKLLAAAQQLAHIGSWEWSIDTNKVSWSDEMCRIYGVQPSKFSGSYEAFLDRVHPDDRAYVRKIVGDALQSKEAFVYEHRIVLSDGGIRFLEARGEVIVDGRGNPVRMVGTGQDITEHKKAHESLQALAKRVVEAQEEERQRIARELHDDVGQRLAAAKLQMEAMEDEFRNRKTSLFRQLQRSRKQVTALINEIRRISANLRPATLDDLGLVKALEVLCREFQQANNIKVRFVSDGHTQNGTDLHIETTLYRIAQEALSNVLKHAHSRSVEVQLQRKDDTMALMIRDYGRGFELQKASLRKGYSGFGLISMKERAMLIGGVFQLDSVPRKGTTVRVEIPNLQKIPYEKNQNSPRG